MAAPFPEAQFENLIYMFLGALLTLVGALSYYAMKLRKKLENAVLEDEDDSEEFEIDKMGLSKKSEDLLEHVLEEPTLQSDLPQELGVSKATVSNAVSELSELRLIKRKKKANTYLIEPDKDNIREMRDHG